MNGELPPPVPLSDDDLISVPEQVVEQIIPPPSEFSGDERRSHIGGPTSIDEVELRNRGPGSERHSGVSDWREVRVSDLFPAGFDFAADCLDGLHSPSPENLQCLGQQVRVRVCSTSLCSSSLLLISFVVWCKNSPI